MTAERIRIAYCLDNLDVGGTETNAVRTAERLDRGRFDAILCTLHPDGPLKARFIAAGIPVHPFRINGLVSFSAFREGRRFAQLLRDHRIDIVHAHDRYTNVFAVGPARSAGAALITSKRWGTSTRAHALLNRYAWRRSDAVLGNSAAVARDLAEHDGVPPDRIVTIPNFLDDADFEPMPDAERASLRQALGVARDALVVGSVSNLRAVKDQASLVRAVARLAPDWPALRLVLVGEGDQRGPLTALAAELGIADRLVLAGARADGRRLQALFDVSVLCSRSEGFPNAVIEAMAAARAVVGTRVGGIPDAVIEGETGLLVAVGDPAALARAIGSLLANPDLRERFAAAGQSRARRDFAAAAVMAQLQGNYERLFALRRR